MFSEYLSCSLQYLSCLVIRVISTSSVSIDVCFFPSQAIVHVTSKSYVSIDIHLKKKNWCKILHVESGKFAKTLPNIHTGTKIFHAARLLYCMASSYYYVTSLSFA